MGVSARVNTRKRIHKDECEDKCMDVSEDINDVGETRECNEGTTASTMGDGEIGFDRYDTPGCDTYL